MELPKCNIEFTLPTPQKLRRVADKAKALEETVVRMDEEVARLKEEHKEQIAEIEARLRDTAEADQKERVESFQLTSAQVKSRIEEAVSILKEATDTWAKLDEFPERAAIQQNIQRVEATATAMKEEIKSLAAL